jgi:SAM-dependent methyltransferase
MTSGQVGAAPAGPAAAPDLAALKQRQQATWASGDFAIIGTTLQIVGETLCEAADLRAGSKVLDVCAGNGNCSLAAARRWCDVTSTDYVPALLEDGRRRAAAERLPITFREADVEALPFADGTFDAVLSSFGVMFAPDHRRSAAEMLRVVRSGGTIAMANWTPGGFIGRMFVVIGRHVPPPAGVAPPPRWGVPEHLELLFGEGAARIGTTPRDFMLRYRSAAHFVDVFRTWYGPVHKAFAALPAEGQARLDADLHELIAEFNEGGDGTMVVPAEYLEIVITKA